jgi:hypothetical protein
LELRLRPPVIGFSLSAMTQDDDRAIDQSDGQHTRRIDRPKASNSATMVEKGQRFLTPFSTHRRAAHPS